MISSNQFTKKSFSTTSNSFSSKSFSKSSNSFSSKSFSKTNNVWSGDNLLSGEFGIGDVFGGDSSTFGIGTFSGLSHFKARTRYDVTH